MSILGSTTPLLRVGATGQGDGTNAIARGTKEAGQVVQQQHGKYAEAALRGLMFAACTPSAGATPGTAVGTTAALSLYNPPGSGKRLFVKKVNVGYISGTLGAGTIYHCGDNTAPNQAAPTGGTAITPVCTDLGNPTGSVAKVGTGTTVANTPQRLYPLCAVNAMLATTATNPAEVQDDVDGAIIVEPGTTYSIQADAAAGTSPKVSIGVVWEEMAII
jgi:hypothetical protein